MWEGGGVIRVSFFFFQMNAEAAHPAWTLKLAGRLNAKGFSVQRAHVHSEGLNRISKLWKEKNGLFFSLVLVNNKRCLPVTRLKIVTLRRPQRVNVEEKKNYTLWSQRTEQHLVEWWRSLPWASRQERRLSPRRRSLWSPRRTQSSAEDSTTRLTSRFRFFHKFQPGRRFITTFIEI